MHYQVTIKKQSYTKNFFHLMKNMNYVKEVEQEYIHREIISGENKYKLKIPLYSKVYEEDGMIFIKEKITNTIGAGKTLKQAITDFSDEFNFAYENYTIKEDSKLTKDAKILKYFLLTIIEK